MIIDGSSSASLWACLLLSVLLILIRISLRRIRGQNFTRGDYWCLAAAVFIIARLIGNQFLIEYGSTRTLKSDQRLQLIDGNHEDELAKRIIGSKMVLFTRSLLICILWCAKMAVLDLLARIIMKLPFERKLLYAFYATLILSFIPSLVMIFLDCQPLRLAWQIWPNPGDCVIGTDWIYAYEICNIFTDVILMIVPFSLIVKVKISLMQRLRVLSLFSIGIILISISIVRIVRGRDARTQAGHTLWASLEVLFAVSVAVTPTIYALSRNVREETTDYGKSHMSMQNPSHRTFLGSVAEGDKYTARIWTELEDNISRRDDTSVDGILVSAETRIETSKADTPVMGHNLSR